MPGGRSAPSHFLAIPALRVGLITGGSLTVVMLASLIAANRLPWLERLAMERNAISYSVFAFVMLVPVARFRGRPWSLFASGLIAWVLFDLAYAIAGMYFVYLDTELNRTPLEVLFEGAVLYGAAAVLFWVGSMLFAAVHEGPIAHKRHPRQ